MQEANTVLQNWIANNNFIFTYQPASPIIENLDYTKYKGLATYEGATNIFKIGLGSNIEACLYTK